MTHRRKTLIDSSAWIEALRRDGDATIRSEVQAVVVDDAAVFCDLVLLELWNGARGQREIKILQQLEEDLECVSTTGSVWSTAQELARRCRRGGLTIPVTDLLVAACATVHDLRLLHRDAHFDQIARVVGRAEAG